MPAPDQPADVLTDITEVLDLVAVGAPRGTVLDAIAALVEKHTTVPCSLTVVDEGGNGSHHGSGTPDSGHPCWSVSVLARSTGRPVGTISLHHHQDRTPTALDRRLLDLAVRLVEAALDRTTAEAPAPAAPSVATQGRQDAIDALRTAIEEEQLRVYFQPEISLSTGRAVGVEALVRWQHPDRGLLAPGEFIALAEETGLIVPLGAWVLREACRQAAAWQAASPEAAHLGLYVNLSARQLSEPETPAVVAAALADAGLPASSLCLEITESVLMEDVEAATAALEKLKAIGVRLAVDDFGTGYSSLGYLKRFPVDVLKVDKAFIDRLGADLQDSAIVAAVVNLARALGLDVIAEGVENAEQLAELRALGCHFAQGFYFARPQPADLVAPLLGRDLRRRDEPAPAVF